MRRQPGRRQRGRGQLSHQRVCQHEPALGVGVVNVHGQALATRGDGTGGDGQCRVSERPRKANFRMTSESCGDNAMRKGPVVYEVTVRERSRKEEDQLEGIGSTRRVFRLSEFKSSFNTDYFVDCGIKQRVTPHHCTQVEEAQGKCASHHLAREQ